MKKFLLLFFSVFALSLAVPTISFADHHEENDVTISDHVNTDHADDAHHEAHAEADHGDHHGPKMWAIIPFALLLLMIATGPLFFEHFWHKNYPAVAIGLGLLVIGYYAFSLHDTDSIIHSLAEYFQFISLLAILVSLAKTNFLSILFYLSIIFAIHFPSMYANCSSIISPKIALIS